MTSTKKTSTRTPAKAKPTTAKRPGRQPSTTGTEERTVTLPSMIRFKTALTKAEQETLEGYLSSIGDVAADVNLTLTGVAVALTVGMGNEYAEEHYSGSLRSWALTGAEIVRKTGMETTEDPRWKDVTYLAEQRGAEAIRALTPAKAKAALVAIGQAETVKEKRAAIKKSVPTTRRKPSTGNVKTVKAEQVAARITKLHESLPSAITGDESTVADLLAVADRLHAEVKRLADAAKVTDPA